MKDHCAAYSVQDFKVILNIIHPKSCKMSQAVPFLDEREEREQ